jgi:hypothetical protein
MIKLVTGGGLGDMLFSFAKLYAKEAPFNVLTDEIHVTHITNARGQGTFQQSISDFYTSQNISHRVQLCAGNNAWLKANRHEFDYYLGSHWSGNNPKHENSWSINPLPPIKYDTIPNIDIVCSPFGGWNQARKTNLNEIRNFDSNRITYIGKQVDNTSYFDNLQGKNMINLLPTIQDFINIIGSCSAVIAQDGFPAFLAGLFGKKVYMFSHSDELSASRVCPSWENFTLIKSLRDINIEQL